MVYVLAADMLLGLVICAMWPSQPSVSTNAPGSTYCRPVRETAQNDWEGSVAQSVYNHARPVRQVVTMALRVIKKHVEGIRRHRHTGRSVWASRRGVAWPMGRRDFSRWLYIGAHRA
jgi:hypothetical protein